MLPRFRFAFRMLMKAPAHTAIVTVMLALGIGACITSFSCFNTVLLGPLPFPDPDRLVAIWETVPGFSGRTSVSQPNFLDWQQQSTSFEGMAAATGGRVNVAIAGSDAERVSFSTVSPNYFTILGLSPFLGRGFSTLEPGQSAENLVLLSYSFWKKHFGGDGKAVGRTVQLDGRSYTILGVMPDFVDDYRDGLWTCLRVNPTANRGGFDLRVLARLKPGVDVRQAREELNLIARRLEAQYPDTNRGVAAMANLLNVDRFGEMYGMVWRAFLTTMGAVGFLLLIVCANVANLLLVRAAEREKEISVRYALGANRSAIVGQLLTETLLLAGFGGGVGLLVAHGANQSLNRFFLSTGLRVPTIVMDYRVLAFTLAVCAVATVASGLFPALHMAKANLSEVLKESARNLSSGVSRQRLRYALIVTQTALSVILLVATCLLAKSLIHLLQIRPGFDARRVLTMAIALTPSHYPDGAPARFFENVRQRVATLPGIEAVGLTRDLPMATGGNSVTGLEIEGQPERPPGQGLAENFQIISAGYAQAMSIAVKSGRGFSESDDAAAPLVMLVNEAMARKHWGNRPPLGSRLKVNGAWRSVIGVVEDVRLFSVNEAANPQMYFPQTQWAAYEMFLVARTRGAPMDSAEAVRREIQALDRRQPISQVRSMDSVLAASGSVSSWQALVNFMVGFSSIAVALAVVGIYGVIARTVAQRTCEFGIRLALGARGEDIVRGVLRGALGPVLYGVAGGLLLALGLMPLLSRMLVDVGTADPAVYCGVALSFLLAAGLASYLPARRAARVDPVVALRYE